MWDLIIGTIAWSCFFLLLKNLNHRCSHEWNSRICALLHAFIGCRWIEYHQPWPMDYTLISTTPNTPWQHALIVFTCSYFIFDLIYCLWSQAEENYMILHHILGIFISFYAYYYNVCGYESGIGFWITELANPFLQTRWFLRTMEWHHYTPYKVNEVLFGVVFLFNRLVLGTWLFYIMLFVADSFLIVKVMVVAVHLFNFFFASQIIGLARRRFREGRNERSKVMEQTGDLVPKKLKKAIS